MQASSRDSFDAMASIFVHTDGADGKLADFEIKYTFGVEPLQQYLVEFPDGRLQALSIAWDTRPKERGGQRWFHLYPNDKVDFRDELHWTRYSQNWNFMCADCHSTDVHKNYDAATNTFHTTFKEIAVGCEACHGPGSAHLDWARTKPADKAEGLTVTLRNAQACAGGSILSTGNAVRSNPRAQGHRNRGLCAMSFPPQSDRRWISRWTCVSRFLPAVAAFSGALFCRRPTAR